MLKRGNRYKLFKLDIELDATDDHRLIIFYEILEKMPDMEICQIVVRNSSNDFLNTLAEKYMLKTKQDLYEILQIDNKTLNKQSEPHEYLSVVKYPKNRDMS